MDKETLTSALITSVSQGLITQDKFEALAKKVDNNTALSIADVTTVKKLVDQLLPLWNGAEEKMTAQRNALINLKTSL